MIFFTHPHNLRTSALRRLPPVQILCTASLAPHKTKSGGPPPSRAWADVGRSLSLRRAHGAGASRSSFVRSWTESDARSFGSSRSVSAPSGRSNDSARRRSRSSGFTFASGVGSSSAGVGAPRATEVKSEAHANSSAECFGVGVARM